MPTQLVELAVAAGVEYVNVKLAPFPTVEGDSVRVLVDAVTSDPAKVRPKAKASATTVRRNAFRGDRSRRALAIAGQHRARLLRPSFLQVELSRP